MQSRINLLIMDTAIRGTSDCTGPITIYWRRIGQFLAVYIEDYEQDSYTYRLFRLQDGGYERKIVLSPTYGEGNCQYLYEAVEDRNWKKTTHHMEDMWESVFRQCLTIDN